MNAHKVSMHATNLQTSEGSVMKTQGRWDGAGRMFSNPGAIRFCIQAGSIRESEPKVLSNGVGDSKRELVQPLLSPLFQLEGNAR